MGDVFSPDALAANRGGQLTTEQRRRIQAGLDRKHSGLAGLVGRALDPLAKDLKTGYVESIEGAITKKVESSMYGGTGPVGYRYRIRVANREAGNQEFRCPKDIYEFAPDAGMMRVFYLPRRRWVVNLERLADAPIEDAAGPFDLKNTLFGLSGAIGSKDEVAAAEACARFDAIRRQVDDRLPADAPAGERSGSPLSGESLAGSWKSLFLSVNFREDGTLSARLPDSSGHEGRWSVQSDGRVRADIDGAPMVADASVNGDELTLVLDGQALKLRRVSSE